MCECDECVLMRNANRAYYVIWALEQTDNGLEVLDAKIVNNLYHMTLLHCMVRRCEDLSDASRFLLHVNNSVNSINNDPLGDHYE